MTTAKECTQGTFCVANTTTAGGTDNCPPRWCLGQSAYILRHINDHICYFFHLIYDASLLPIILFLIYMFIMIWTNHVLLLRIKYGRLLPRLLFPRVRPTCFCQYHSMLFWYHGPNFKQSIERTNRTCRFFRWYKQQLRRISQGSKVHFVNLL